ncbi:MAG: YceI family protein [Actinomycetota bacterium]
MNRVVLGIAVGVVAVIVAVGAFIFNRSNAAPDEFELTDTSAEAAEESDAGDDTGDAADDDTGDAATGDASGDSDADAADSTDGGEAAALDGIDGTWTVADGSEAGYRVVEDISGITDFEAVGRTSDVSGTIEVAGTTVTSGEFSVLVGSIASDDRRRDSQFANDIMNSREFPNATLVITEPIELGSLPEPGAVVNTTAQGELTLRDVTNAAPIAVAAQVLGDQIEIVASVDVLFSDYNIDNPSNPFVTVRDEGKVEVKLLLSRG